jgi:hypothetical protein
MPYFQVSGLEYLYGNVNGFPYIQWVPAPSLRGVPHLIFRASAPQQRLCGDYKALRGPALLDGPGERSLEVPTHTHVPAMARVGVDLHGVAWVQSVPQLPDRAYAGLGEITLSRRRSFYLVLPEKLHVLQVQALKGRANSCDDHSLLCKSQQYSDSAAIEWAHL